MSPSTRLYSVQRSRNYTQINSPRKRSCTWPGSNNRLLQHDTHTRTVTIKSEMYCLTQAATGCEARQSQQLRRQTGNSTYTACTDEVYCAQISYILHTNAIHTHTAHTHVVLAQHGQQDTTLKSPITDNAAS